ncbi:MAG TPA: hypothetical protein DD435_06865 [Cyanobacteria bacterium UBA8530]|nr:hypothetical protein [Cyanobacteria bacterium UBA8530]
MKKTIAFFSTLLLAAPASAATVYNFQSQASRKEVVKSEKTFFPTEVGAKFGARFLRASYGSGSLAGLLDSELDLGGAYRVGDWLMGLELSRWKASVNVSGLSDRENPAFSLENANYRLSLGRVLPWGNGEWTPQVIGLAVLSTPSSSAPFSGTPYDYNQSRLGLGLGLEAAQPAFFCPCWTLKGGAALYPWMMPRLDKAPYQLGWLGLGEVSLGASRDIADNMAFELAYRGQLTGGSHLWDQNHRVTVGLSYRFLGSEQ